MYLATSHIKTSNHSTYFKDKATDFFNAILVLQYFKTVLNDYVIYQITLRCHNTKIATKIWNQPLKASKLLNLKTDMDFYQCLITGLEIYGDNLLCCSKSLFKGRKCFI